LVLIQAATSLSQAARRAPPSPGAIREPNSAMAKGLPTALLASTSWRKRVSGAA
jgi:hypothetical protein